MKQGITYFKEFRGVSGLNEREGWNQLKGWNKRKRKKERKIME